MAVPANLASMLKTTPLFARITSRADRLQLERLARCEMIEPGTALITQGSPAHSIDIIQAGEVSVRFSDGTVESLRLGPGSLYGEMEFFQKTPGLATVVATESTSLLRIAYADLSSVAEDNPMTGMQLYHGFLNTMVGKHRLVTDSLIDVKLDTSRQHLMHDLKTPLSVLRVLADNATSLPEDQRDLLHQVTLRIESIVAGLSVEEPEPRKLLQGQDILTSLRYLMAEKKAQLGTESRVDIQCHLPASLQRFGAGPHTADLLRAVSNILNNAIEALPAQGGQVTLRAHETTTFFALHVHDNGSGMPSDLIDQLGTHPLTVGKAGGQGIGLFYAFRLIESLGGQMVVQSDERSGTLVGFRLPARLLREGKSTRLHTSAHSHAVPQSERAR